VLESTDERRGSSVAEQLIRIGGGRRPGALSVPQTSREFLSGSLAAPCRRDSRDNRLSSHRIFSLLGAGPAAQWSAHRRYSRALRPHIQTIRPALIIGLSERRNASTRPAVPPGGRLVGGWLRGDSGGAAGRASGRRAGRETPRAQRAVVRLPEGGETSGVGGTTARGRRSRAAHRTGALGDGHSLGKPRPGRGPEPGHISRIAVRPPTPGPDRVGARAEDARGRRRGHRSSGAAASGG